MGEFVVGAEVGVVVVVEVGGVVMKRLKQSEIKERITLINELRSPYPPESWEMVAKVLKINRKTLYKFMCRHMARRDG